MTSHSLPGPRHVRPRTVALLAFTVLFAAVALLAVLPGIVTELQPADPAPVPEPDPTPPLPPDPQPEPQPPAPEPPAPEPEPEPEPEPPSTSVPTSLVGTEWSVLPTDRKVVALTFDAGANADAVAPILATLATEDVPATFFLTGAWVRRYPDLAAQIGEDYVLGNHSDTHPAFTELSDAAIVDELDSAWEAIHDATGQDTRPWFRFPFGDRDARTIATINDAGYGGVRWTVDTLGWKGTSGGMTADAVVERVLDTLQPGQIVLMHVGSHPTDRSTLDADALPRIISELRARGYDFVALSAFG